MNHRLSLPKFHPTSKYRGSLEDLLLHRKHSTPKTPAPPSKLKLRSTQIYPSSNSDSPRPWSITPVRTSGEFGKETESKSKPPCRDFTFSASKPERPSPQASPTWS